MIFNGDGAVLRDKAARHFPCDQTPSLFLRRGPLKQNARGANQQPSVTLANAEKRLVVSLRPAEDEPAVAADAFRPYQRHGGFARGVAELRFMAVPDQRPSADLVAPVCQALGHSAQPLYQ